MSEASIYRRLACVLWNEPWFQRLSKDAKLVTLYAKTGPQTRALGLVSRFSIATAAEDLPQIANLKQKFTLVVEAAGWRFDAVARVLLMPDWLGENPPQSPNVCKAWAKAFREVPGCALKVEAARALVSFLKGKGEGFRKAFGEVSSEALPSSFDIQDQDQDQDSKNVQAGAAPRPPKLDDPDDNIGVITTIAHETIGLWGEMSDLDEAVKSRIAELNRGRDERSKIRYDSSVVGKAIESARWQRAHKSSAPREKAS